MNITNILYLAGVPEEEHIALHGVRAFLLTNSPGSHNVIFSEAMPSEHLSSSDTPTYSS